MDSIYSNRFAREQEAAVVRQALALDELDRVQLEQRERTALFTFSQAEAAFLAAQDAYTSAKAFLDETRARKNALVESTRRKQGLLHPLRKVPECVLGLIFDVAVVEAYKTDERYLCSEKAHDLTSTLAAVCRRWRSAALCSAKLWRFIHLSVRDGYYHYLTPDPISCFLELRVKRSGKQHLRLSLDLWDGVAHNDAYARFFVQVRHLLSRCQSFAIFVPNSWTAFRGGNVSSIFDTRAPALEELHLRAENCIPADEDDEEYDIFSGETERIGFLPHCPKLREVVLGNVETHLYRLKDRLENPADDATIWVDSKMCTTDLLWTLRLYPALRKLTVDAHSIADPDDGRTCPVVTHASLRRLEMSLVKEAISPRLPSHLRLPALRKAEINSDGCSKLMTQRIIVSAFISQTLANVSVLILGGVELDATVDRAVGGLRKLKDFRLSAGSMSGDVFALTHGQQTQYPALTKLDIVEADVDGGFTGSSLLNFIRARRAPDGSNDGTPTLEYVNVTWNEPWVTGFNSALGPGNWDTSYAQAMAGQPAA